MVNINFDSMFEGSVYKNHAPDAESLRNRIYPNDFVVASINHLSRPLITVGQLEVTPEGEVWVGGEFLAGTVREDNSVETNDWVHWLKLVKAPKIIGSGTLTVPAIRAHDYLAREFTFKNTAGDIITGVVNSFSNHSDDGIVKLGIGLDDHEVFYGTPVIVFYP